MTLDSTLGGGRKLFLPTFMRMSTRDSSWVFTDKRQYSLSPGLATSRWANSLWNIRTAHLKNGRWSRSLKTNGEDILYGKLATHTSKKGSSLDSTSPTRIFSLLCTQVDCTRFWSSATSLESTSQAITCLHWSSNLTVMLPVPGPTSSTTSVGLRLAWSHQYKRSVNCHLPIYQLVNLLYHICDDQRILEDMLTETFVETDALFLDFIVLSALLLSLHFRHFEALSLATDLHRFGHNISLNDI